MSRLISDILAAPEPAFSHQLQEWERLAGHPAIDLRLATQLREVIPAIARILGLDGNDTTAEELYFGLRKRALEDEQILARQMGIESEDQPMVVIEKIVAFVEKASLPRDVWVIKGSAVKPLLKANQPKKLMKLLGYRSIDSVLKRKSVGELMSFASLVEPNEWQQKFRAKYKKLTPSDFALQQSELRVADNTEVEKMRAAGHLRHELVMPNYELGCVVVVPSTVRFSGDIIVFTAAILESLRAVRMHSAYYRVISVLPTFGQGVVHTLEHGLAHASKTLLNSDWSHIHALHGHNNRHILDNFQPNLQPDDLHAPSAAKVLSGLRPEFVFWSKYPYAYQVGSGNIVSSDLFDVAINASNDHSYASRTYMFGKHNLSDELHARYLLHEPIAQAHLKWYDDLA